MRRIPNDVSRDAKPSLWVYQGRWALGLIVGTVAGIFIFRKLAAWDVELIPNLVASIMPLALYTLYVVACVNGRAPSYAFDLWLWARHRVRIGLFNLGLVDRVPELILGQSKAPAHPSRFSSAKAD
jgi:hypothetical protein